MTGRRIHGFTLIETIASIVILSIVAAITFKYIAAATITYTALERQNRADEEIFSVISRMRRECRTIAVTTAAETNSWTFQNRAGQSIRFWQDGTNVKLNADILASDVSRFILSYYDTTNGVLSAPVSNTGAIHRVSVDISVVKGGQVSALVANVFYPRTGIVK